MAMPFATKESIFAVHWYGSKAEVVIGYLDKKSSPESKTRSRGLGGMKRYGWVVWLRRKPLWTKASLRMTMSYALSSGEIATARERELQSVRTEGRHQTFQSCHLCK
jgi:hypothetical protein